MVELEVCVEREVGGPFPGCRWKSLTDEVRISSRTLCGLLPESGAAFSKPI